MTRSRPRPERPKPPAVRVEGTRCPYCHDQVGEDELSAARVCERCLSRHHGDCWEGRCASCQHERALGVVAAVEGGASRSSPTITPYAWPPWLRFFNLGYLLCMMLSVVLLPVAVALEPPDPSGPPPLLIMAILGVTTAVSLGMWFVNSRHALRTGASRLGRALALLSPLTGGASGLAYFVCYVKPEPATPPAAPPTREHPKASADPQAD